MSNELQEGGSQKQAEEKRTEPSLIVKLVAIMLGTGGALLAAYFGFWVYQRLRSYAHRALNDGIPRPEELPPALQSISPVIWNEAKRLTKNIPDPSR